MESKSEEDGNDSDLGLEDVQIDKEHDEEPEKAVKEKKEDLEPLDIESPQKSPIGSLKGPSPPGSAGVSNLRAKFGG